MSGVMAGETRVDVIARVVEECLWGDFSRVPEKMRPECRSRARRIGILAEQALIEAGFGTSTAPHPGPLPSGEGD